MLKKIWGYGTSTPIQRIGIIILFIGFSSLLLWVYKAELAFEDLFNPYYMPRSRDSFIFHLFIYLIPIGLLMSFGYRILIKLKEWVFNDRAAAVKYNVQNKQKKFGSTQSKQNLHFKNNSAAFEFASTLYNPNLLIGQNFFGILRTKCNPENEHSFFIIELAGSQEKILVTGINDKYLDLLNVGNIVYWRLEENFGEKRILDIVAKGYIMATLNPEYNPTTKLWSVRNNLTK